jgi:hypothetical protein
MWDLVWSNYLYRSAVFSSDEGGINNQFVITGFRIRIFSGLAVPTLASGLPPAFVILMVRYKVFVLRSQESVLMKKFSPPEMKIF